MNDTHGVCDIKKNSITTNPQTKIISVIGQLFYLLHVWPVRKLGNPVYDFNACIPVGYLVELPGGLISPCDFVNIS